MTKNLITIILLLGISILAGCQGSRTVAFSRLTDGYWQIWTMQPDGKDARQITSSPSDKRYPVWLANSNKLFYRDNDAYAFIMNLDNGKEERILESFGNIGRVVPSPDGKKLVFIRFRTELLDSSDLWICSIDGRNERVLTHDIGLQYDPAFSPDGSKIAYISGHGHGTYELYVMDSDGKNKKKLTNDGALELFPVFSPDGSEIAYTSNITGDFEIWVMNADGTNARQLTDSHGIDSRPNWSPNGQQILFTSNRTGVLQLWIMNNNGTNPRQLTKEPASNDSDWRTILK